MARGGESRFRFELTRLELAGLIVSTAASLFIVFLLGVYAGHGIGDRHPDDAERVVRLPVAPAAAEETPAAEQDLTFDETLGNDEHPTRVAGAAAAAAERGAGAGVAEHGAPVGAAPEGAVRERAPVPPEHVVEAPHPAPAPAAALPRPAPEHAAAERPDPLRVPAPGRTPSGQVAVALAAPQAAPGPVAALPPSTAGEVWSVQVTATREPQTADDLVKRLRARGYDAYIVRARRDGGMFYRVRVGHFPSMEHASQMVSRLRHEPGVPEAFVASD